MKRILLKTGVLILMAMAAASAYIYRDAYLQYMQGGFGGESVLEQPAAGTQSIPVGTRDDPYIGIGVIQEIQADSRQLVIAHQAIPGLMDAMTMAYPVSEEVRLDRFAIGEDIEFRMETLDPVDGDGNSIRVFALSDGAATELASGSQDSQAMFTVDSRHRQLIGVRTAPVTYQTLDHTVRTIGTVAVDETRVSEVHPKVTGWIEESFVDFQFQHVQKGDPLFTLYSPELVATQEEYILALRGLDLLGTSSFPSVRFGSEDLVRAARRRLELWDITAEQIAELEEVREPFRAITIHSPVTGHVMVRNAFPGQRVAPETRVYEIVDHSVVWVKADIYENDIASVREDQRAVIRIQALPGREFTGRVTFIDPHVNAQTRTLTARIEVANPSLDLKPEMYAEVELTASMGRRLVVPESAVLPTGLRNVVFVDHGDGEMEIRNIRLGARVDDHYEVLGGLSEGERIVTSGNFLIDSESKLQAAEPVWQGENPQ